MSRSGHVEFYVDKKGNGARRFWVHERVLCGGSIISQDDYEHLKLDFGVTGVMNFCNDIADNAVMENAVDLPFADDGNSIPSNVIHDALDWASMHLTVGGTILYVHCALGGSRGPSMAYAICRGVLGMTADEVFASIQIGHPVFIGWKDTWNPKQYIKDIDEALLIWKKPF